MARDAPHFEFTHCHGLGVLVHGANIPPPLSSLLNLPSDGEVANVVRSVYSRLAATCEPFWRPAALRNDRLDGNLHWRPKGLYAFDHWFLRRPLIAAESP